MTTTHVLSAGWAGLRSRIEKVLGFFLAILLFGMMLITLVDVVGRYFLDAPVPAAFEITQLTMGVSAYLGLILITLSNESITVQLLHKYYHGAIGFFQATIAWMASFLLLLLITWRLWVEASTLSEINQTLMFLGIRVAPFVRLMGLLAAAATLLLFVDSIVRLLRLHESSSDAMDQS